MELSTLKIAQLGQRRVADDLLYAAAQLGARHWRSVDRAGYWAGDAASKHPSPRPVKLGCAWTVLGGQQNAAKSKLTFARAPLENVAILICRSVVPLPA